MIYAVAALRSAGPFPSQTKVCEPEACEICAVSKGALRLRVALKGKMAHDGGVPGTTDGTILTRDGGLATVVYRPGGSLIAHQADEYVEIEDAVRHALVYVAGARRFLAGEAASLSRAERQGRGRPTR